MTDTDLPWAHEQDWPVTTRCRARRADGVRCQLAPHLVTGDTGTEHAARIAPTGLWLEDAPRVQRWSDAPVDYSYADYLDAVVTASRLGGTLDWHSLGLRALLRVARGDVTARRCPAVRSRDPRAERWGRCELRRHALGVDCALEYGFEPVRFSTLVTRVHA